MIVEEDIQPPSVTTFIPTFRRPWLMRRAITSALGQGPAPLQVCVYDNASGDETTSVVSALALRDPRIHYHRHDRNLGAAANFEFGLRRVKTRYFSILSDDDYLLPGFYQRALADLTAHPEAMFWVGITLNVDESGVIWDARVARWPREGLYTPPDGFVVMTGGRATAWTGMLFRREALDLVGLPDPETGGASDLEFCLKLATRYPFIVRKHPCAVFTLNSDSYSATQPLSAYWPGWQRMTSRFANDERLANDVQQSVAAALYRDGERMLWRRSANAIAAGRFAFAHDAADALGRDCGKAARAAALRMMSKLCASSPLARRCYTSAYRSVEARIIHSRGALQEQYGDLLRPVRPP